MWTAPSSCGRAGRGLATLGHDGHTNTGQILSNANHFSESCKAPFPRPQDTPVQAIMVVSSVFNMDQRVLTWNTDKE